MEKLIGKGYLGQSAVVVIAILLVLKLVLPYIAGTEPGITTHKVTIDKESVQHAIEPLLEPIQSSLRDLKSENANQTKADDLAAKADTKLLEAITNLSHQQEMTATAVANMQKWVERVGQ